MQNWEAKSENVEKDQSGWERKMESVKRET